ncbi:speckle-type POZ protein-like [Planococcus citri]|uniref:speckle-type POZ protein-like n=1 Tax=Planococcus citri TaxID=170843 RepID=UPI0031F91B4E
MPGENIFSKIFGCIIPCREETGYTELETSSDTGTQIHTVKIMWTIDNFDFHVMKKNTLKSNKTSATTDEECAWYLAFEPSDRALNRVDNLSSYFCIYFTGGKALAKSDVSILNGQQKPIMRKTFEMRELYNTLKFHISIPKELIITPENKLSLTICCSLSYSKIGKFDNDRCNTIAEPSTRQLCIPDSDHAEKIASLYDEGTFADVTLSTKIKNYSAHKAILAAHSPVFASMFEASAKKGKVTSVNISGIDEQVLGEILRYIYTGECENLDDLAHDLLIAADRYGLDRLKMICADVLYKQMSVQNATDLLVLADKRGLNELKSEAIKFIAAKYIEISNEETWQNAIKKKPHLVHDVNQELYRHSSARNLNNVKTSC